MLTQLNHNITLKLCFKIPFFFTVDAAAVLLPVHLQAFGRLDTRFPSGPEIIIVEWNTNGFADRLTDRPDPVMILEFAVQKGRGESVELSPLCNKGGRFQAFMIAVSTPIRFPESHIPDESFQFITLLVYDLEINMFCIRLQCFLAPDALRVRVDIVSVKIPRNIEIFVLKVFYGGYGARGAAYMQKDFHVPFHNSSATKTRRHKD